jgi:hypothetical protein
MIYKEKTYERPFEKWLWYSDRSLSGAMLNAGNPVQARIDRKKYLDDERASYEAEIDRRNKEYAKNRETLEYNRRIHHISLMYDYKEECCHFGISEDFKNVEDIKARVSEFEAFIANFSDNFVKSGKRIANYSYKIALKEASFATDKRFPYEKWNKEDEERSLQHEVKVYSDWIDEEVYGKTPNCIIKHSGDVKTENGVDIILLVNIIKAHRYLKQHLDHNDNYEIDKYLKKEHYPFRFKTVFDEGDE